MPRDPAHPSAITPDDSAAANEPSLPPPRPIWLWLLLAIFAGTLIYLLTRTNYLLFHVVIELLSVVLAAAVFTIGWNTRRIVRSPLLLILATGFLTTGLVDLLHLLSYKGMGVFPVADGNLATQLWVTARFLEAAAFLVAALHLGRTLRFSAWFWLGAFASAAALLLAAIWPLRVFPACFVEGVGLTPFKIACEYLVATVLAGAALLLWRRRDVLGLRLSSLLLTALCFNVASELSFTLYTDPFGTANVIGHLFKLITVIMVYLALIEGMLRTPYGTLFLELTALNRDLDAELRRREASETQLLAANREFALLYRVARALHSTLSLDALTHLILSMAVVPQGGGFLRSMLFTVNQRTGVLQGMLGIDRHSAVEVLPATSADELWGEPRLDAATRTTQRETTFNQTVIKQRLPLAVGDNALAKACLEQCVVLIEGPDRASPGDRRLAKELALDAYACVPLNSRGQPFGVLVVDFDRDDQAPVGERLRYLDLFASQASAALENARLLHRLEEAHRELRDVQEQLIQGEKLAVLGEMSAQLAHELRNPLVAVGGFAQRLVKLDLGNDRAAEYAAIIAREVRRLEEMLGNILTFSKQQTPHWEGCDLNILLAEALELEAAVQQSAGITLELETVAPLPEVIGDPRQLRQVLLNLLSNARQAMPKGGVLSVRATPATLRGEEGVSIEVEDTGGGIPTEIMRNIFNPFFSTHPKGTGIGLSLSHRIISQHHGEIEVCNGVAGACFTIRLPLRPPGFAAR